MTVDKIYEPSKSLRTRLSRRLVRYQHRNMLATQTKKPVVSFTFDDCPKSVIENAFPILDEKKWKSTLYIAMGLCNTTNHLGLHMSEDDVLKSYKNGHEIGNHTFAHLDARSVSCEEFLSDILKNEGAFKQLGIPKTSTFAYPYGEITAPTKSSLSEVFDLKRGIHSPSSTQHYDLNQTASQRLYSGTDLETCLERIKALKKTSGWLILFTHDVRQSPSDYGCTPEDFRRVVEAVDAIGADVMPVAKALDTFKNKTLLEAKR